MTATKSDLKARAGRATAAELCDAVSAVNDSDLVGNLLHCMGSVMAVLNEERQILAANDALLQFLGLDDATDILGQRPGEAMNCAYADTGTDGCGSGVPCRECGALLAVLQALQQDAPAERECLLTTGRNANAMEFKVRAVPIRIDKQRFVLVQLNDIRSHKRRQALERIFFHDVMNTVSTLNTQIERLENTPADQQKSILQSTRRALQQLTDDIREQQILSMVENETYRLRTFPVATTKLIAQLEQFFATDRQRKCRIRFSRPEPDVTLTTDPMLLKRVLINMLENAVEATPDNGEVHVFCGVDTADEDQFLWRIWNEGEIPAEIAARLFQRYFTTKPENGRGVGAYSMKLLGEKYLQGRVWFQTDAETGTTFFFALPRRLPSPRL